MSKIKRHLEADSKQTDRSVVVLPEWTVWLGRSYVAFHAKGEKVTLEKKVAL